MRQRRSAPDLRLDDLTTEPATAQESSSSPQVADDPAQRHPLRRRIAVNLLGRSRRPDGTSAAVAGLLVRPTCSDHVMGMTSNRAYQPAARTTPRREDLAHQSRSQEGREGRQRHHRATDMFVPRSGPLTGIDRSKGFFRRGRPGPPVETNQHHQWKVGQLPDVDATITDVTGVVEGWSTPSLSGLPPSSVMRGELRGYRFPAGARVARPGLLGLLARLLRSDRCSGRRRC